MMICYPLLEIVIDSAIKGTLLLFPVVLVAWLLARHRPVWQGVLWKLSLVALLLLPISSTWLPKLQVPILPAVELEEKVSFSTEPPLVITTSGKHQAGHKPGVRPMPVLPLQSSFNSSFKPIPEEISHDSVWSFWRWLYAAAAVYLIGLGFSLLRMGVGLWRINRLCRQVNVYNHSAATTRLNLWCARLGVKRSVRLAQSDQIKVPTVVGIWRPLIVIPATLAGQVSTQPEFLSSRGWMVFWRRLPDWRTARPNGSTLNNW